MTDPSSDTPAAGTVDRTTVHDLLAADRRRHVLACLADHGTLALPDLADQVAERERDTALPQIPEDEVLTVYLSLYHTHVPKLADADVVRYSQNRDTVALAADPDSLDAVGSLDDVVSAD